MNNKIKTLIFITINPIILDYYTNIITMQVNHLKFHLTKKFKLMLNSNFGHIQIHLKLIN